MIRGMVLLVFVLALVGSVSAVCGSGEVDINIASLEELDSLYGIGPAKAQAIIDYRSGNVFEKLDDLINVNGIGEVTLSNIKSQGLACVTDEEEGESEVEKDEDNSLGEEVYEPEIKEIVSENGQTETVKKEVAQKFDIINLNPQDIKSEENSENKENNYAFYGLIAFSAILGTLFAIRAVRKNRYKNEFG